MKKLALKSISQLVPKLVIVTTILFSFVMTSACKKRDYQNKAIIVKVTASSQHNGVLSPFDFNPINLFDGFDDKGKFNLKNSYCEGKEDKTNKLIDRGKDEFVTIELKAPVKFNRLKLHNGHGSQFKTYSRPSMLEVSAKFKDEKQFGKAEIVNLSGGEAEQTIALKEIHKGEQIKIAIKNIEPSGTYYEGITCMAELRFGLEEKNNTTIFPVSFLNQDIEQNFKEYEETAIKAVRDHLSTQNWLYSTFTNPRQERFIIRTAQDSGASNGQLFLPVDYRDSENYPSGYITEALLVEKVFNESNRPSEITNLKPVLNDINGIILEGTLKDSAKDSEPRYRIRFRYVHWKDAREEYKNQNELRSNFDGYDLKENFTMYIVELFNETGGNSVKTVYLFAAK